MHLSILFTALAALTLTAHATYEDSFPRNINPLFPPQSLDTKGKNEWRSQEREKVQKQYAAAGEAEVKKQLRLLEMGFEEVTTIDKVQADWHCTDSEYERAKHAFDSAVFLAEDAAKAVSSTKPLFKQIFGSALPKAKTGQNGNPSDVKKVFDAIADLRVNDGMDDVRQLKFVCHKKNDGGCGMMTYAFVPMGSGQIHLCPKFWKQSHSLDEMPQSKVGLKTTEFCNADSGKLMDLNSATILHELTHSIVLKLAGITPKDDHGYDIRYWWKFALKMKKGVKGTILDLTPTQAEDNADSYSWFAILNLRTRLCGIKIIRMEDKLNCRSDHWILKLTSKKGEIEGDEGEGSSHSSLLVRRAAAAAKKGSTAQQGAVCCPKGQKEVKKKNPKTGKMETDCKCAKTNMIKQGMKCIACPKGQKADPTQTKCVAACPVGQKMGANNKCVKACPAGQKQNAQGKCVAACPVGQKMGANNKCVKACPAGQKQNAQGKCVAACPAGQKMGAGNKCVKACPAGQKLGAGNKCVKSTPTKKCPAGQKLVNNKCVKSTSATSCRAGQKKVNGKCVPVANNAPYCKPGMKKVNGKCVNAQAAKQRAQKEQQLKAKKQQLAKQKAARNKKAKQVRAKKAADAKKKNGGKGGKGKKKSAKCKGKACKLAGVAF